MSHRGVLAFDRFLPSRFLLEPLEPRCLLDGTVLEDAGVDEDHTRSAPLVTLPATIHQNPSARNPSEYGFEDYYRLHVNPQTVYDVHAFLQTTGMTDESYDVSLCDEFIRAGDEESATRWRFGADQDCYLSVYSNERIDYTVQITAIPDDS